MRGHRCNGLMSLAAALPKVTSYSWPSSAAAHSFEHVNAAIQRQGRERRHRQRIAALMIRPRLRTVRGMASVVRQRKHPSNSVASCFEVEVCANRASSLFEPRSKAPIGRGPQYSRPPARPRTGRGQWNRGPATERTPTSAGYK